MNRKIYLSFIIRNISYGIFTVLLMCFYLNVNAQLTVDGKQLLDPHGDQVIIRGVENVYGWVYPKMDGLWMRLLKPVPTR